MSADVRDTIRRRFDERAEHYDASVLHRAVADAVARFVPLSGVEAVLDVATGTGLLLRALRERLTSEGAAEPRLFGVDLSSGMLAVARRELPDAVLHVADAAALPLPDAAVDLVTCVTALHVIPEQAAAIREWRRVLRPHGRAVTATFAEPEDGSGRRNRNPYPVNHAPFASPEDLARTMTTLGFSLIRHESWTNGDDTVIIAELAPQQPNGLSAGASTKPLQEGPR